MDRASSNSSLYLFSFRVHYYTVHHYCVRLRGYTHMLSGSGFYFSRLMLLTPTPAIIAS
jgi:hypothetical protein